MWHVSSRSGVATLRTAIHLLLTYLLTYYPLVIVSGTPAVNANFPTSRMEETFRFDAH